MPRPIIEVQNLSKLYRLGTVGSTSLRESVDRWWHKVSGKQHHTHPIGHRPLTIDPNDPKVGPEPNTIWSLKDVSFTVNEGEAVGIIGRNGAGKSTLLKILSRITEPTSGKAIVRGRASSLLEVGTGFHPELTGKENIYLNGSILGMRKSEIDRKFDEIVSFSDVSKFIDTPVKRYSSGMYVRLAFAVAAHLETEILIVDEVLAVGDASFQKKCLGKMAEAAKCGRTVLFVSHHIASISRLCRKTLWIDQGQVKMLDNTEKAIAGYLAFDSINKGEYLCSANRLSQNQKSCLRSVRLINSEKRMSPSIDITKAFDIEIEYEVFERLSTMRVAIKLITSDGTVVFVSTDFDDSSEELKPRFPGIYMSRCRIPSNFLNWGQYSLNVSADVPFVEILFSIDSALIFNIEETGGVGGRFPEKWPGVVCPKLLWNIERL